MVKLQQKAAEQPEQKKSNTRGLMEGAVNQAFQQDESELRRDVEGSKPAARKLQEGLPTTEMHPVPPSVIQSQLHIPQQPVLTGNEGAQNYFDPSTSAEGDPRRCRMSGVGGRDELELRFMNADEKNVYERLSEMLQEDTAVVDLPGMVLSGDVPQGVGDGRINPQGPNMAERTSKDIPHYLEQLRECVQKDMIPVGRSSMKQEERGKTEKRMWARKQRIRHVDEEEAILRDRLYAAFQRYLHQHQAEVTNQCGELTEETENTEPTGFDPEEVEWTRTPQPIEVLVLCLRAVREKLPRGLYSVNVSLQTQLGGRTLHWSRLRQQQWAGNTQPVEHQGRYCDTELNINQSLCVVREPQKTALLRPAQRSCLFNLPTLQCALASSVFFFLSELSQEETRN
ncbi:hypothetical protein DNTS_035785 [Danionella cerebrum]|uniref:Uncharacterized protein n=1 Tax=Danionella cerebrum TaxID=2873325 RepID=A0A553QMU5_9TELE|nr:hypothetical protein DNTS_035785 [Danionella translucida]